MLVGVVAVATLVACTNAESGRGSARPSAATSASAAGSEPERAAAIANSLADADLAGQVLMPFGYGTDATNVPPAAATANRGYAGVTTPAEMIARYRLGGMILTSRASDDPTVATNPTTNVESPDQIRRLTDGLQAEARKLPAGQPLLTGIDQEYGTVTRIRDGVVQLPSAMTLGAGHDPKVTERAWRAAGTELAALGVNADFAPDADVLGSTAGGVIGSRSFGSDPAAVSDQVAAAVRGLRSGGVAATLKHFPGHGRTVADSHTDLPVLSQDRAALEAADLAPFRSGIGAGADLVMSGHLDARALDPGVPASFSSKILIDLLRGQLGFDGVVVSDALNMAPAKRWQPGEAAVRALVAGNDLLLMPPDLAAAHAGLLAGLKSGTLPRQRLVQAVTRVLTLKLRLAAKAQPAMSVLGSAADQEAAAVATAAGVSVLRGPCDRPVVSGAVRVTTSGGREQQRTWLREALIAQGTPVTDTGGTRVHLVGYGDATEDLATDAAVTVAMDTPYLLARSTSGVLLATYSSSRGAMAALAAVLAGKSRAPGRSPVTVAGLSAGCGG